MRKVNLDGRAGPGDEEEMERSIFASGMLQHIGPVDISRRAVQEAAGLRQRAHGAAKGATTNGYDWRLSPHLLSRKLMQFWRRCRRTSTTRRWRKGARW